MVTVPTLFRNATRRATNCLALPFQNRDDSGCPVDSLVAPRHSHPSVTRDKITSMIGPDAVSSGDLCLVNSMYVAGTHIGRISVTGPDRLVAIKEGGYVDGAIESPAVYVAGRFTGRIKCQLLQIYSSGEVTGQVEYDRIIIHDGGRLQSQDLRAAALLPERLAPSSDDTAPGNGNALLEDCFVFGPHPSDMP